VPLKLYFSKVPDPPPAAQSTLAGAVAMETEYLQLGAVDPGMQLVIQLEPALEYAFRIAICCGDARIDDLTVVGDAKTKLEIAEVR
jgi:hypothetical protein